MSETPPRAAASLLLVRDDAGITRVLMGLRGAGHRFMPNRLVFPGGATEPADHAAPLAGPPASATLRRLARHGGESLARALLHAAARELEEETGLTLGTPPDVSGLDYLCRAVTPPDFPIRFDARFLVADAAIVTGTLVDSSEMHGLRWFAIDEALALDLVFPTRKVLEQLTLWLTLTPAERAARDMTPVLLDRTWIMQ